MLNDEQIFEVLQHIQYSNIRILGKGTNGTVYYAVRRDGLIKKEVALKVMLIHEGENISHVVREAALVSKINHANIVMANTTFVQNSHLFIEYDYVNGLTLSKFIKHFQKINYIHQNIYEPRLNNTSPVNRYYVYCCLILSQILNGLQAAYDEIDFETDEPLKIIHRDLCPANIMISKYGIVKITDFGLAYQKNFDLSNQIVIGKLAYCSPEQLKGKGHGYDQAKGIVHQTTDIFSIGVIFYELITQKSLLPLEEMNIAMKKIHSHEGFIALRRHLIEHIDLSPISTSANVPPEISDIILKAIKLNPKKRYQKYEEVIIDLSRFLYSLESRTPLWNLRADMAKIIQERDIVDTQSETILLKNPINYPQ